VGRDIIEEVAETFDLLPNAQRGRQSGDERAGAARIFTAAGRSELWAAGASAAAEGARARQQKPGVGRAAQVSHEQEVERELEGEGVAAPDTEEVGRAFRSWDSKGDS
jgi:hypothetical protein